MALEAGALLLVFVYRLKERVARNLFWSLFLACWLTLLTLADLSISPPKTAALSSFWQKNPLATAEAATVKVESLGCGSLSYGSGFIVGENLIATNAHVVSGANEVAIYESGQKQKASVVSFDPASDIAILRVKNLSGRPLSVSETESMSYTSLGFPDGGDLKADYAQVVASGDIKTYDIYGQNAFYRRTYEIKSRVMPGDSGGPLINHAGQVVGMVFAASTTSPDYGYAFDAGLLLPEIKAAKVQSRPVSTGFCLET